MAVYVYHIQGTVVSQHEEHDINWTKTQQIPSFCLIPDIQGIINEDHAEEIARRILSLGIPEGSDTEVNVSATFTRALENDERV